MMQCEKCHQETFLPFTCPYCGSLFCAEHRLPENHDCSRIDLAKAKKVEAARDSNKQEYFEYTITYGAHAKSRKTVFSPREIGHLAIATALVFVVGLSLLGFSQVLSESLTLIGLLASIVTVSFLSHEMAHKYVARSKGLRAEFRLTLVGAILTSLSAISPLLKVIAPGAVVVSGYADRKTFGRISLAGPLTNLIFASSFLIVFWFTRADSAHSEIFLIGAVFNSWLSLINLLPVGILDGLKVFEWDKTAWIAAFSVSVALTILTVLFNSQLVP